MIADVRLDPAAIELGNFFPRPPEAVWRALTDPDALAHWFVRPTGFATTPGTCFRFTVPDAADIHCRMLTARPCAQLTHTWHYPRADYPAHWIVDWTLHPQGRGTRLLLTQTGFDLADRRQKMARNAMERTWKRRLLPRLAEAIHH
ncbi:SRPBCC family protein [Nocardia sp. NPDC004722]